MGHCVSGSYEAAREQADVCHEHPSFGTGDVRLEIFCEPAAATEPGDRALDDPASWQDLEAFLRVGTLDDLDDPAAHAGQFAAQLVSGVAAVGKDAAQPWIEPADCREHLGGAVPKGGQLVAHVKALPGAPYDGHTLATIIPEIEAQIGADLLRIIADRGYRGHNVPLGRRFKVFIAGQKRRVTKAIKREPRRRSAIEPVIGHLKAEHRMGRNYLAHAAGDATNAVLAAAGYNFRRLLAWLAFWLTVILNVLDDATPSRHHITTA